MFIVFKLIDKEKNKNSMLMSVVVLFINLASYECFIMIFLTSISVPAEKHKQHDDEKYDTVAKIKFVYEGKRVKEFRVTGNLNKSNTKTIMANMTPHIEMRTKIIYSFKSEIHRGAGEIVPYGKRLTSPPGMFTSLEEIQAYIEECEQKRLDLYNEEVWSKAYLPAERTTDARSNYEGKVMFK